MCQGAMGSLWWKQWPTALLGEDVAAAGLSVPRREQGTGESLGKRFSTGEGRSCGIKELWCSSSHQQAPTAGGPQGTRGLGAPALLPAGNANPTCPCSGSHWEREKRWEKGSKWTRSCSSPGS